jgi:hypothetical protein
MSSRTRQLIFVCVVISALICLVYILIYGSGYRLDAQQWKLVPTGSIRFAIEPANNMLVLLLPDAQSSTKTAGSFTHLLPGTYHFSIEATGYYPINYTLEIKPSATIILEPIRLWPDHGLFKIDSTTAISEPNLRDGLTLNKYSLDIKTSANKKTIIRLSQPITAASWIDDTPYIAYSTASEFHIIDTREQTDYHDQLISSLPEPITQLSYDKSTKAMLLKNQTTVYSYPLEVAK